MEEKINLCKFCKKYERHYIIKDGFLVEKDCGECKLNFKTPQNTCKDFCALNEKDFYKMKLEEIANNFLINAKLLNCQIENLKEEQ